MLRKPNPMGFFLSLSLILGMAAGCASSPSKPEQSKTERAKMLVQMGNAAYYDGDLTGALSALLDAERDDPTLPDLHHSKALVLHAKGERARALEEARIAVRLKPDYSEGNNTLGKLLLDEGKLDEAIPYLNLAAKDLLNREAFKAYTNLGILYYRKADFKKARENLDHAIRNSAEGACIAYYYRGHLKIRDSRFREAIDDYEKASRNFCGSFADAHLALGVALKRNGQVDQARKKFLEIQQQFPSTRVAEQAIGQLRRMP